MLGYIAIFAALNTLTPVILFLVETRKFNLEDEDFVMWWMEKPLDQMMTLRALSLSGRGLLFACLLLALLT